jgi:uncharacterized protein (TIGR03067 family)
MRNLCIAVAVCLCASVAILANADDKPLEGDLGKIQGKWSTMVGPEKTIPMTLEVKGTELTIQVTPPQGAGRAYTIKGEIKLDESPKPKAMDWTKLKSNGKAGEDIQSIYELDGDNLKILGAGPGKARPAAFKNENPSDSRDRSMVFKREKEESKKSAPEKDATKTEAK